MTTLTAPVAASRDSQTTLTPAQRRALLAGSIGNAVEWVDWAVYSAFAAIFAGQFFPPGDPTVSNDDGCGGNRTSQGVGGWRRRSSARTADPAPCDVVPLMAGAAAYFQLA